MNGAVFNAFSQFLVDTYYKDHAESKLYGWPLIDEILAQLNDLKHESNVKVISNSTGVEFQKESGLLTISHTYSHKDFPNGENREEVNNFVKEILIKVFF